MTIATRQEELLAIFQCLDYTNGSQGISKDLNQEVKPTERGKKETITQREVDSSSSLRTHDDYW